MREIPQSLVEQLVRLEPVSIAITGSLASGEETPLSDAEIAIVFEDENYRSRSELAAYTVEGIRVYPFRLSEIRELKSSVPFPIQFYFWWLQSHSRTVWGDQILEKLKVSMARDDWKEVLSFERGIALSAMIALRNGDRAGAEWGFSKSCLFGTLAGVALHNKEVTSYREIVQLGSIEFPDFRELIEKAEQIRQGSVSIENEDIFQNLDYLYRLSRD